MSQQAVQQVLCRGIVDAAFTNALLTTPHAVLQEYDLSLDEYAVLAASGARSLIELAQAVESWRRGDMPVVTPARVVGLSARRRSHAA